MSTLTPVTQSLLQSWLQTDPEPRHAGETLVDAIRHALPASYKSAGKLMAAELATERRANPDLADVISAAMIREQDAEAARNELASRLFASTGVRANVRVKDLKAKYSAMTAPEAAAAPCLT